MTLKPIPALLLGLVFSGVAQASAPVTFNKLWTAPSASAGFLAEIPAFDASTNTVWVAGVTGVDVLNASNGSLLQHIDTTGFGSINSVAIHNGLAAFAMESSADRTLPGQVVLFDTASRSLASGVNQISVGALPDMLTFSADGSKLLVANEATPVTYGAFDPAGSVSIINMNTRTATTAGLSGVATAGSAIRSPGMDFEPEYIAINAAGTHAFVTLQEHNAMGVLDMNTQQFTSVIGLGTKDFSLPGNEIDPSHKDSKIELRSADVQGFYQPDAIAAYDVGGQIW